MLKEPAHTPPDGFIGMSSRVSGPDPLQKNEGKLFDIVFTEENILCFGLVPHPHTMSPQVHVHLMGQDSDVTALPFSVASSTSECMNSSAALS
jgi:hypothetical protein